MSWFGSLSNIDAEVEKATNESIPFGETDLAASLEVADVIRSKKVPPKEAMRSLKRRLTATKNPNTQMSTLHLIDTCVKNGGNHFIVEMATREFMDTLVSIIHEDRTNESVRDLALELVQNWATAFKDNSQLKYMWTTYNHLKDDGYSFPSIGASVSSKLFDSSAPPEWEDSDACMICSTKFSMLNRKHHCRNCGGVYCQSHSSKNIELPHLGITEPVRVCDTCYDEIHHKKKSIKKSRRSKHQQDVSRARAQYDSDDDEDLKRALELSLKESQAYHEPPVPQPVKQQTQVEDEDEDMKAAIAASLREFEQEKQRQPQVQSQPQVKSPYNNLLPQASTPYQPSFNTKQNQQPPQSQQQYIPPQQAFPPNYVTLQDEAEIMQFANKVQDLKNNPGHVYDNPELTQHYRQAIPLTPKLAIDLHESMSKHDELVSMNQKIDTIMKMYNSLLDRRIERETQQRQQQYSEPSYPPEQQEYYPSNSSYTPQESYAPQIISAQSTYQSQSSVPQPTYQPQPTLQPTQPESPYPMNAYPEPLQHEQDAEPEVPSYPPQQEEEEFSAPPSITTGPPVQQQYQQQQQQYQQASYPPPQQSPVQQTAVPGQPQVTSPVKQRSQPAKITDFSFPSVPVSKPPVLEQSQAVEVSQPKEEALIEL
jgi:growth factor-regulated tyrosine kinase substrate